MVTELWAVGIVIICAILGAFGPIFLKKGTNDLKLSQIYKNYNLIFGIFLYGISLILFVIALTGGEVSILYPLVSTSYIWVAFLSEYFLNEKMTKNKWKGIFFIILGVFFLALTL